MKKSYRLHIEGLYKDVLKGARIQVKKVTAHKDASATIACNEKTLEAVKKLPGVEILAEGKTEVTFRIPAAVEWHSQNPPNFSQAERDAQQAERDARKAQRAARRAAAEDADEEGDDGEDDDGEDDDGEEPETDDEQSE